MGGEIGTGGPEYESSSFLRRFFRGGEKPVIKVKVDPNEIRWGTDPMFRFSGENPEQFQVELSRRVKRNNNYSEWEEISYSCMMRIPVGRIWAVTVPMGFGSGVRDAFSLANNAESLARNERDLGDYLREELEKYKDQIGIPGAYLKIVGDETVIVKSISKGPLSDDLVSRLEGIR